MSTCVTFCLEISNTIISHGAACSLVFRKSFPSPDSCIIYVRLQSFFPSAAQCVFRRRRFSIQQCRLQCWYIILHMAHASTTFHSLCRFILILSFVVCWHIETTNHKWNDARPLLDQRLLFCNWFFGGKLILEEAGKWGFISCTLT